MAAYIHDSYTVARAVHVPANGATLKILNSYRLRSGQPRWVHWMEYRGKITTRETTVQSKMEEWMRDFDEAIAAGHALPIAA